jgi:uncharacterized membrane protein
MEDLKNETNVTAMDESANAAKERPQREYSFDQTEQTEKPVTVKQWLLFWLVSLINIIPFIGFIAYVIFILYVAFKNDSRFPVSMKNFCKAYLVVLAVGVVLALIFAGSIMGAMMSSGMGL